MKAFYFANHTTEAFDSGMGQRVVGAIDGLEPGAYVAIAKADIGVNAGSSPAYPHGGGALTLRFGGATDVSYVGVRPESGLNGKNVALMVAAKTAERSNARVYFQNPYPLRVFVNAVRLVVFQLDDISISYEGEPLEEARAEDLGAALIQGALMDVGSAALFTSLMRHEQDD